MLGDYTSHLAKKLRHFDTNYVGLIQFAGGDLKICDKSGSVGAHSSFTALVSGTFEDAVSRIWGYQSLFD